MTNTACPFSVGAGGRTRRTQSRLSSKDFIWQPAASEGACPIFARTSPAVEPIFDHPMSQRFRLLAVASDDFPGAFNITGMNGDVPLIPFDPGAAGVPDTSVFHQGILGLN
jgi:hypothetical protein